MSLKLGHLVLVGGTLLATKLAEWRARQERVRAAGGAQRSDLRREQEAAKTLQRAREVLQEASDRLQAARG